jgi:hypothetical protein
LELILDLDSVKERSQIDSDGAEEKRMVESLGDTSRDLDRKFWTAMVLYAVLAALAWFTMGEGSVLVDGRQVDLRLVPLVVLGGLAVRTVLARQAEKIRKGSQ